jgi:HEAT repeat protein
VAAPAACEHTFVTSQGRAYSRFQRALATGKLDVVEAAAKELPRIGLDDALLILCLLADSDDPRFDRAAARWIGRLLIETPAGLSDARFALALVEQLPKCRDALHGLARRR